MKTTIPKFTLVREGKEIMTGTETEIMQYIHQHHSYSVHHATTHEGYQIVSL